MKALLQQVALSDRVRVSMRFVEGEAFPLPVAPRFQGSNHFVIDEISNSTIFLTGRPSGEHLPSRDLLLPSMGLYLARILKVSAATGCWSAPLEAVPSFDLKPVYKAPPADLKSLAETNLGGGNVP